MAVYGIAENKCLKEVVAKDEVYTKGNFIHYEKFFNNADTTPSSFEITKAALGIDTTQNLFVVSHMCSPDLTIASAVPAYSLPNEGYKENYAEIFDNRIVVHFKNPESMGGPMVIHLVFMKLDD